LAKVKNKCSVDILSKEKFIKSLLEKGDEICAYERLHINGVTDEYFLVEIKM